MKLAIVGSTRLGGPRSRKIILDAIQRHGATEIVSGGAKGVDSLAERMGEELGLRVTVFRPEYQGWEDKRGLRGFRTRNQEIAEACDILVRIAWCPEEQKKMGKRPTYGSGWTRDRAKERGKSVEEFILTLEEDSK